MPTPSFKGVYQTHSHSAPTLPVLQHCASALWFHDITPGGLGMTSTSIFPCLLTSHVENMETEGRDHKSIDSFFTVTHFDGNVWFFNYFLIIYDTVPLVCKLFQLMWFCYGECKGRCFINVLALNSNQHNEHTPHDQEKTNWIIPADFIYPLSIQVHRKHLSY